MQGCGDGVLPWQTAGAPANLEAPKDLPGMAALASTSRLYGAGCLPLGLQGCPPTAGGGAGSLLEERAKLERKFAELCDREDDIMRELQRLKAMEA